MKKDVQRRESEWATCRVGNHRVRRNMIVVHYEPGFGLCGRCIIRRSGCLADYWTEGRAIGPVEQSEQVGRKD